MWKHALATLMLGAVLAAGAARAADPAALLLVGNKSDDTLSFVDTATRQVLGTATTGSGPHEVTSTPDGKLAFVANYEGPGDSISVIDVAARKELRKIPLDTFRGPHGIVASAYGKKVYATCERSQTVIELDIATEKITRSFKTGQNGTHMLALTPDGKKLYTANIASGTSSPVDLTSGVVGDPIPTGPGCEGIDITPDGKQVWTTNNQAATVSVISTETNQVLATLACPGFPIRVKITPDGKRALVSCPMTNDLAVFDVATRKELQRVATGVAPVGVLIAPDGKLAYVANTGANKVTVLDLEKLEATGEIVAGKTPDGLALAVAR